MSGPIRVCDGDELWVFDGDIGLASKQIGQLLTRTRPPDGDERNLEFVAEQCFEMFGKRIRIWRVPSARATFSVVARS